MKHLTVTARAQIELILSLDFTLSHIAKKLRVHHSTISREVRRQTKGSKIINRISIEKRPIHIEQQIEYGHWEGDSIVSAGRKSFLNTLVERKTRYFVASILKDYTAHETAKAVS